MKKYLLLLFLCAVASAVPAQKKMYVWVNEVPTEFTVLNVDSVTFADALPEKPEPEPLPELLSGLFSVSAAKQVQFSRGNLQYTQSTATWSLAEQQYYVIGTDNVEGDALADKIDLFGWSGDAAPTAEWGISTSTDYADYSGEFKDWGQNIGYGETWRTLSQDEWKYLFETRANASSLRGVARINLNGDGTEYANGVILLPDDWQAPAGIVFKSGLASDNSIQAYADHQTLALDEWQALETNGAVFLPAAGRRNGESVSYVQCDGYYWSDSYYDKYHAYSVSLYGTLFYPQGYYFRFYGLSVRLVQDSETVPEPEPEPEPVPAPLSGVFSVSTTQQIQFSCGNLRYTFPTEDGGEAVWSFAAHQYECIGTDNVTGGEVSSTTTGDRRRDGTAFAGTIDLFGWSGDAGSEEWGIGIPVNDHMFVDDFEEPIKEGYGGAFKDWGQNIGDGTTWRTLTGEEWGYLLNTRDNASDLKGVAKIDLGDDAYVNGLILLPDNWQAPDGIAFQAGVSDESSVAAYGEHQTFTLSQWEAMEAAGAVFLPVAGEWNGTFDGRMLFVSVVYVQYFGYYWSATPNPDYEDSGAYCLDIYSNYLRVTTRSRDSGYAVRLVRNL